MGTDLLLFVLIIIIIAFGVQHNRNDIDELKRQINELKRQINKLKGGEQ